MKAVRLVAELAARRTVAPLTRAACQEALKMLDGIERQLRAMRQLLLSRIV